jgi:hypothetical protein
MQCEELRNEAKTMSKVHQPACSACCQSTHPSQSNDELKKLLLEMQGQLAQGSQVAALEAELADVLHKLQLSSHREASYEARLSNLEQELRDYQELNDLLEIDNAKCLHSTQLFTLCR